MMNPQSYKPETPEWVLAKFLEYWKKRRWVQILNFIQPSWVEKQDEPNRVIKYILPGLLQGARLVQLNANTGAVAVYLVQLWTRYSQADDDSTYEIRVYREGKRWVVCPTFRKE